MKKKTAILIICALLICSCFYLHFENTELQISNYDIADSRIQSDFKIIQVSDFHNTKSKSLTEDLVNEIKSQEPDIIVITGDLIDSGKTETDVAVNFVKNINNVAHIYFVSGNHEASVDAYSELKKRLSENNVTVLDNKVEILKADGSAINIIGIDDPRMAHETFVSDSDIIKTELSNINYDENNFSVLLSHRPELFNTYVSEKIDLVLTGHAHGGQIRIPFVGGLVAPNQGLFPKYTSGKFEENKTAMIVSRGIGNSILPFRINNRPELIVVKLSNK